MPDATKSTVTADPSPEHAERRGALSKFRGVTAVLRVLLALGVTVAGTGCGMFGGDVWVYVDNAGTEPIVVTIIGSEETTVDPGHFAMLKHQPGKKRIQVRRGQQLVFNELKDLQKCDQFGVSRRFLFNPDRRTRYVTCTAHYGQSPFERLMQGKEPASGRGVLRAAYHELAAEVTLVPAESWVEVPAGAIVLTKPPKVVLTRGYTEKSVVLTRVTPRDYPVLEAAGRNANPSAQDLLTLAKVVDRVQECPK
jgi:hypothetical protein